MRYALLFLGACGFKGAPFGSDAQSGPTDVALASDVEVQADAPVTITSDAALDGGVVQPLDAMVDANVSTKMCPAGGQKIESNTFYFSSDQRHFSAAETACEALSKANDLPVHLATPKNVGEAMKVANMQTADYEWIGVFQPLLSPGKDKGWLAITGGDAYTNWAAPEPNDGNSPFENGTENFAQMYGHDSGNPHGSMNDTSASDNLFYVCECDGAPADPVTLALVPFNL